MQPQRLERLKRMINGSSMFTPKEKEEWLNLLVVMNDKQVFELETILDTPVEKQVLASPQPVSRPPLTHISNLPSGIAQAVQARPMPTPAPMPRYPLPKPAKPTPIKLWENKLRRTMEEKELSQPKEEKLLPAHATQKPSLAPHPKPAPTQQPALPPKPTLVKSESTAEILDPKDVAKLNLGNMRAAGSNLTATLKKMVSLSNYFEVLFYLEKSPLYQAYIDTGREALKAGPSSFPAASGGKNLLAKGEFEAFSDLLKSIQIS